MPASLKSLFDLLTQSATIIHSLGWNLAGGNMESTWQQSSMTGLLHQADCFLHNKPILMGRWLTLVSQQEVLSITEPNLHSVISDNLTLRLDIVVARWGFSETGRNLKTDAKTPPAQEMATSLHSDA